MNETMRKTHHMLEAYRLSGQAADGRTLDQIADLDAELIDLRAKYDHAMEILEAVSSEARLKHERFLEYRRVTG